MLSVFAAPAAVEPEALPQNPRFSAFTFVHCSPTRETSVSRPLPPANGAGLFFCFFMFCMSPAPSAVFFDVYFALNELLVFARPVVGALALFAGELYQLFLSHSAAL